MTTHTTNQVVSESIKYVPHYRTLTDAGKAHFSEVAYAVADLVDNSIQVIDQYIYRIFISYIHMCVCVYISR
jgi:hypothetical protein